MKKILVCLLAVMSGSLFAAELSENFKAGGYSLNGYASLYSDGDYSSINLSPSVTYFLEDDIAVSGGFSYGSSGNTGFKSSYFNLTTSLSYVFKYDAKASSGPAYSAGVNANTNSYTDSNGNTGTLGIYISPYVQANYFFTPYVSVYGNYRPLLINLTSGAAEVFDVRFDTSAGISIHLPTRLRDWSRILK
jgi:hypothetical protein